MAPVTGVGSVHPCIAHRKALLDVTQLQSDDLRQPYTSRRRSEAIRSLVLGAAIAHP
jgi:hypothetical protein